jgi:hypothetical protein
MAGVSLDTPRADTYDDDPPKFSTNNAIGFLVSKLSSEKDPSTITRLLDELIRAREDQRNPKNSICGWTTKSGS